jgi:predicted nuclease with TOPRIM domain
VSSENHLIRFLKGLYPISELVRAFDLHFSSQDTILRRLSELEAVQNEIREVRDRLKALESNPALLSEISGRLAVPPQLEMEKAFSR